LERRLKNYGCHDERIGRDGRTPMYACVCVWVVVQIQDTLM
jgi:hypothetical protein